MEKMNLESEKCPYILYMTTEEEHKLRNWITTNQLDINICLSVPPDKRRALSKLLELEIEEAVNKPVLRVADTAETDHEINETKHILVDDIMFKEVTLAEHISEIHTQLTRQAGGVTISRQNKSKAINRSRNKLKNKDKEDIRTFGMKYKNPDKSPSGYNMNFVGSQENRSEYFISKIKLDGTLDPDYDSSMENTKELELNVTNSEKENEAEDIVVDVNERIKLENDELTIDEKDEQEEMNQSDSSSSVHSIPNRIKSHSIRKRPARRRRNEMKLKSFSERWSSLRCSFCKKTFASEFYFNRHMKQVHPCGTKKIDLIQKKPETNIVHVCSICKKQFSNIYSLRTHLNTIHSESRVTYQCDLCGAVLKHKGSLGQHMKTVHTDARPHKCCMCGKHFKIYQQLRNHERTHDPNHIETCSFCGKSVRKGQLSIHMRRHGDDKKYMCDTCGRRFFDKQDCIRHERTHTGEKPYKCSLCPYACANKGNLTSHLLHKHRVGDYDSETPPPAKKYRIKREKRDDAVNSHFQLQDSTQQSTIIIVTDTPMENNIGENGLNPAYSILNTDDIIKHSSVVSKEDPNNIEVIQGDTHNLPVSPYTTVVYNTEQNAPIYSTIDQNNDSLTQVHFTQQTHESEVEDGTIRSDPIPDSSVYHNLRPVLHQNDVIHQTVSTSNEVPLIIAMQSADGQLIEQNISTHDNDQVVTIISYDSSQINS